MFCSKCGKKIKDGSIFCPECGTKLQADPASQSERGAARQEAAPPSDSKEKPKNPAMIVLAIVGGVIGLLSIIYGLMEMM